MSGRQRVPSLLFWTSLALALLLAVVSVPEAIRPLKPFFLALVVIYWALETPERMGIGLAFCLGLAGDLVHGNLLGEQAMRLAIIAFIVLRIRPRMRFFPMLQQSLAVLALLLNDRVVTLGLRAFAGEPMPGWTFWLAPVAGAVLWPWLFLLFDVARARARLRDA